MAEEEKQSGVHLAIAKHIVDTLADGESDVTQQVALEVLKPWLEDNIAPIMIKNHKIPDNWFTNERTPKLNLSHELASYLQLVKFVETEISINDINKKFTKFKA